MADDLPLAEPPQRPERFLVRKLGKEFLLSANEVEWLQASGNYMNLHVRGRAYPLRSTMAVIEPNSTRRNSCACIAVTSSTWTAWPRSSHWTPGMPASSCAMAVKFPVAAAIVTR